LRVTFLLALPAAAALALLAVPLVATLFHCTAQFQAHDVMDDAQRAWSPIASVWWASSWSRFWPPGSMPGRTSEHPVKIAIFTLLATQLP
jgi:putative peptidoglycan lipid II flippase